MQSNDADASSATSSFEGGRRAGAGERAPESASPLRVGTDIVAVADVAQAIARFGDKYVARLFTPAEIAYCVARGESAALHYAARFAAKEATMKVLRPSKDDALDWQAIEVVRLETGVCEITLRGAAEKLAREAGITSLAVSLSHEAAYAVAVVLAQLAGRAEPVSVIPLTHARMSSGSSESSSGSSSGSSRVSPISRIAIGGRAGSKLGRSDRVGPAFSLGLRRVLRGSRGGVSVR